MGFATFRLAEPLIGRHEPAGLGALDEVMGGGDEKG